MDVLVSFDRADAGTLYIDIHYSIRGVNDPRNLVFPFYVIPEEPGAVAVGSRPPPRRNSPPPNGVADHGAARTRTSTTGISRTWSTTRNGWSSNAARSGPTTTSPTPASP